MNKSNSRSAMKSRQGSSSTERDIKPIASKTKLKKKKKLKSKISDSKVAHVRADSESERSASMAGMNSSFISSSGADKESIAEGMDTSVSSRSKAHRRDLSIDKIAPTVKSSTKSKKKSERVVVHVRMRPFNKTEIDKGKKSSI